MVNWVENVVWGGVVLLLKMCVDELVVGWIFGVGLVVGCV